MYLFFFTKNILSDGLETPVNDEEPLLQNWVEDVEERGLEEVRKIPGYHDESLRGDRGGQRSIRLSRSYRAFYRLLSDHVVFVLVEEVNKHEY